MTSWNTQGRLDIAVQFTETSGFFETVMSQNILLPRGLLLSKKYLVISFIYHHNFDSIKAIKICSLRSKGMSNLIVTNTEEIYKNTEEHNRH